MPPAARAEQAEVVANRARKGAAPMAEEFAYEHGWPRHRGAVQGEKTDHRCGRSRDEYRVRRAPSLSLVSPSIRAVIEEAAAVAISLSTSTIGGSRADDVGKRVMRGEVAAQCLPNPFAGEPRTLRAALAGRVFSTCDRDTARERFDKGGVVVSERGRAALVHDFDYTGHPLGAPPVARPTRFAWSTRLAGRSRDKKARVGLERLRCFHAWRTS